MVAMAAKKAKRIAWLWPGRARPVPGMPPSARLDTQADPLPPRLLTAAELIAMARTARLKNFPHEPT